MFKIELSNLNGQITQLSKTHIIVSISPSYEGHNFIKPYKKNVYVPKYNWKIISPKATCCSENDILGLDVTLKI